MADALLSGLSDAGLRWWMQTYRQWRRPEDEVHGQIGGVSGVYTRAEGFCSFPRRSVDDKLLPGLQTIGLLRSCAATNAVVLRADAGLSPALCARCKSILPSCCAPSSQRACCQRSGSCTRQTMPGMSGAGGVRQTMPAVNAVDRVRDGLRPACQVGLRLHRHRSGSCNCRTRPACQVRVRVRQTMPGMWESGLQASVVSFLLCLILGICRVVSILSPMRPSPSGESASPGVAQVREKNPQLAHY
jgi:hypothetical protein